MPFDNDEQRKAFFAQQGNGNKINSKSINSEKPVASTNVLKNRMLEKGKNPRSSIGLEKYEDRGWVQLNLVPNELRDKGNALIEEIVAMSKKGKPDKQDYVLNSSNVFNEYNNVQKTLAYSEPNIRNLLKWRYDGNPKTWKWVSPIVLTKNDESHGSYLVSDDQNMGWVSDAYKKKVAVTLMSPKDFLKLAAYQTYLTGKRDDIFRGEEYTEKNLEKLMERMRQAKPIDTVYLIVDKDFKVYNHEGQHRALAAIKAGIDQMPVYVYKPSQYDDSQLQEMSMHPLNFLKRAEA